METPIFEYNQKNVDAAFDSVNLINALNEKNSLTEDEQARKDANIEHLKIMMSKPEFVELLNNSQKTEINNLIN